jgi:hypothetical protein
MIEESNDMIFDKLSNNQPDEQLSLIRNYLISDKLNDLMDA